LEIASFTSGRDDRDGVRVSVTYSSSPRGSLARYTRRFVERTIQFSRTEGTVGSGVGGDTLVSRRDFVKSGECLFRSVLSGCGGLSVVTEAIIAGEIVDLGRESYSQAFQREGPVILRDVLRSAQPPQFVAACCWAADSSRGALPVKGFLWGRVPFVRRWPPSASRCPFTRQRGRPCTRSRTIREPK
jgi:hypothetical protein